MLDDYVYALPNDLIASEPFSPREQARLLVYHRAAGLIEHKKVADLPTIIKEGLFVVNNTKVLPARLYGTHNHESIELLVLVDQGFGSGNEVRALVNRRVRTGEVINVDKYTFKVIDDKDKSMLLHFSGSEVELYKLLDKAGETPLPPYIKSSSSEAQKRQQYQTTFAKEQPSVAAPTASLHFSDKLVSDLKESGNEFAEVTLQVGLGTFAPIFEENFKSKTLHKERYQITQETSRKIKAAKANGKKVVTIGTTVTRTTEAAIAAIKEGRAQSGNTDIFIFPPYKFQIADHLLTNFHVPKSSLMCLVDAFLKDGQSKHGILDIYKEAINERYRFYSFGDAMLIL